MPTLRSFLAASAVVSLTSLPAAAQARLIDEGTLIITKSGAPTTTESFRIRTDNGNLLATGQVNAGARRVTSTLTTDSLGTPIDYKLDVRDNGSPALSLKGVARAGRFSARSQLPHGDESMREYPMAAGNCLILDDDLLHQLYFLPLSKRTSGIQVIAPGTSRGSTIALTAHGLEPVTIAGKQVTGTHYTVGGGGAQRDFWIDGQGRLLKVEIPAQGLVAVREELPR